MSVLYSRLLQLCEERGVTGYRMAKDAGVSVNLMTDLKSGRKKGISAEVANKLSTYFGVSVGCLLGEEDVGKKKKPVQSLDELLPGYSDLDDDRKAKVREYIALLYKDQCSE